MKRKTNKQEGLILGTTSSGKSIFVQPILNQDFNENDHMDAYRAHARYLTYNELDKPRIAHHRRAMNLHYLAGVTNG